MARLTAILLALGFLLSSCTSIPPMTPAQRRAIQTRTFQNTSYENVFRAFKTVLQDEGYVIKNQDMEGGLILATIQKSDHGARFWATFHGGPQNYRTGESFEVSVNLEKIGTSIVETRLVVQKIEQYSLGGQTGDEILEPELYQALYQKVQTEVERRKAMGK